MRTTEFARWRSERSRSRAMVLMGTLLAAGCGGGTGDTGNQQAQPDMAQLPPDMSYPAGPYGTDVDSVLANLTFQGYYSPTKATGLASDEQFGTVTFDMLRGSGARIAVMQLAAFW